jgi:hypothetical protein
MNTTVLLAIAQSLLELIAFVGDDRLPNRLHFVIRVFTDERRLIVN